MKIPLIRLFLAGVLLFTGGKMLGATDTNSLLEAWFATQTNLHTWSADAVQTRIIKTFSQPLVSTGKVWVVTPDKFRWELGQPPQTIAIRQPTQLVLIYPRLKRAEKYPLDDKQPGPWRDALALLEASFPRSRAELESRFSVDSIAQTNGLLQVALRPKSAFARKFMSELQLGLQSSDFTPAFTELRFSDGSSMRNDFANSVTNAALPDNLFQIELGPDVKVTEPLKK
jgi:outer membrane lipoprotein-sorting protein